MKKLLLIALTAISLASCGGKKEESKEILVYGPESMEWINEEIASKLKKEKGIDVKFVGVRGLVARMKLEKANPKADIAIGLTSISSEKAKMEELISPYKPKNSEKIKNSEFIMDEEWYVTPFDYGSLAINYDMTKLGVVPTSFEELKTYEKQLINIDPRSFTGQETMLWTIALYGDKWLDFWKGLKPAILTTVPSWDEAFAKFNAGEAPMMFGFASSNILFNSEEGNKYDSFIPSEGGYVYLEGAALVKKKNMNKNAEIFMNYLLEDDFQKIASLKNFMFPVTDVEMPEDYEAVPKNPKVVSLKGKDIQDKIEEYQKQLIEVLK